MKMIRRGILIALTAMAPLTGQAATVSEVATQSDNVVVLNTAEATVTATGRTDLYLGDYPRLFQVGTWTAKVTNGSVAFKWGVPMTAISSEGLVASTQNSTDATKKIELLLNYPSGNTGPCSTSVAQTIDGALWRSCPQGITEVTSGFLLNIKSALTPGSYPISIDVAAFAY
ncbi:hypothetical protein [Rahnella sp. PAMC 25559]|uniref:hypothetical protein n=1 Tax=Rahnella sp. PAMC 25559 TaxID=3423225 RepID=UPI003D664746